MEHIKSTLNNMGLAVPSSPVTWDQFKPPPRPWLKRTRLSRTRGESVRAIADRWESEETYTANLEQAILLQDAVNRGDLDAVRQIAPLLVAALESKQKRRRSPSYKSISIKEEEEEDESETDRAERVAKEQAEEIEFAAMGEAIFELTGADWKTNLSVRRKLRELRDTRHYGAKHIQAFKLWWYECWWKGRDKGEPPTFKDLCDQIGVVGGIDPDNVDLSERETNPYLRDPYFRQMEAHKEAEQVYAHDPGGAWEQ